MASRLLHLLIAAGFVWFLLFRASADRAVISALLLAWAPFAITTFLGALVTADLGPELLDDLAWGVRPVFGLALAFSPLGIALGVAINWNSLEARVPTLHRVEALGLTTPVLAAFFILGLLSLSLLIGLARQVMHEEFTLRRGDIESARWAGGYGGRAKVQVFRRYVVGILAVTVISATVYVLLSPVSLL
jgi:hypothetical protein